MAAQGMATAQVMGRCQSRSRLEHGDRAGYRAMSKSLAVRTWRPQGSPLRYYVVYLFSYIVVATLAVAMLRATFNLPRIFWHYHYRTIDKE